MKEMFGVAVFVVVSVILIQWFDPFGTRYSMSLVCREAAQSQILAEHAYITYNNGLYTLRSANGDKMTYAKSGFAWCITLPDSKVYTVTSQGAK